MILFSKQGSQKSQNHKLSLQVVRSVFVNPTTCRITRTVRDWASVADLVIWISNSCCNCIAQTYAATTILRFRSAALHDIILA